jgi:hypothetical protein
MKIYYSYVYIHVYYYILLLHVHLDNFLLITNYLFRNRKKNCLSNSLNKTIKIKQEYPEVSTINVQFENQNFQFVKIKQENQDDRLNDITEHYEYVNVKIFFILNICTSHKVCWKIIF